MLEALILCAWKFRILAKEEAEEAKNIGKWILISSIVGFIVGFAVVLFHYILVKSDEFFTNLSGQRKIVFLVFLLPTLGLFLSGLLTTLAPEAKGDGLNAVIDSYHKNWGKTRSRAVPIKLLASSLTLGSGGSAGALGPAIQMGGNTASLMGDEFKLAFKDSRTITACGMAASFSAILAAPISGAVFACEVLYGRDIEYKHLNYAVISSIVAYFTGDVFLKRFEIARKIYFEAPESLIQNYVFKPVHIPIFILLGVTCAFFGILFIETLEEVRERFNLSKADDYVKTAIGGLLTGLIALLVGLLTMDLEKGTLILGLSVELIQDLIEDPENFFILVLFLFLLGKLFATSATLGSGVSGGVVVPSLAMGAIIGAIFAAAFNLQNGGAIVIVGSVIFFAAVYHVPITGTILVAELFGFEFVIPAAIGSFVAILLMQHESIAVSARVSKEDWLKEGRAYIDLRNI